MAMFYQFRVIIAKPEHLLWFCVILIERLPRFSISKTVTIYRRFVIVFSELSER